MTAMHAPSASEFDAVQRIVHAAVPATPQYAWPLLREALGAEVWVKHENHTPLGAFKVRGGLVYLHRLVEREEERVGHLRRGLRVGVIDAGQHEDAVLRLVVAQLHGVLEVVEEVEDHQRVAEVHQEAGDPGPREVRVLTW